MNRAVVPVVGCVVLAAGIWWWTHRTPASATVTAKSEPVVKAEKRVLAPRDPEMGAPAAPGASSRPTALRQPPAVIPEGARHKLDPEKVNKLLAVIDGVHRAGPDQPEAPEVDPNVEYEQRVNAAKEHFEQAQDLYQAGLFVEAAEVFLECYSDYPNSVAIYNAAYSLKKANQCDEASVLFQRYLDENPTAKDGDKVTGMIRDLRKACVDPMPQ